MRFQKRAPSFAVGEVFAVKLTGEFFLVRVVRHEGEKAHVVTLPEGGFGDMVFQRKPSGATRAIMFPEEAKAVLSELEAPAPDVPDRKTRFKQLQSAKKSMDPFDKANALSMLARRYSTQGFNSDDKVLYRQLRIQLSVELAASLGMSEAEVDALLAAKAVPNV